MRAVKLCQNRKMILIQNLHGDFPELFSGITRTIIGAFSKNQTANTLEHAAQLQMGKSAFDTLWIAAIFL